MKKLEKDDLIKCHDEADLENWLACLGERGFSAVACQGLYIRITSVPEEEERNEEHVI